MKDDDVVRTRTERVGDFLRANVMTGVLIFICLIYILKGLVDIERTEQTIDEIIASCFLSFCVSMAIKIIMRKRGIENGFKAPDFKATQNAYGIEIESISDKINELDKFCEDENALRLKQAQVKYLTQNAVCYDDLNKYNVKPDKNNKRELEKYKICKKARKITIYPYTSKLITNAYDSSRNEEELLRASTKTYQANHTITNFIIGILCAVLFGYYTLGKGSIDWRGMLWATLQIAIYLTLGFIEYLNAYEYVTKTIREKIKRIMIIIDKFKTIN